MTTPHPIFTTNLDSFKSAFSLVESVSQSLALREASITYQKCWGGSLSFGRAVMDRQLTASLADT
jgi:hypothetical protein